MTYPKHYRYRRLVQAKLFIDAHFTEDIQVSNIADEASFSKYHFIRLFKEAYGFTPRQYLIHKRLELARHHLQQGKAVTETCFATGFGSMGTFSTLFKEKTGQSPSQFKAAYQQRLAEQQARPAKFIPGCFLGKSNFQEAEVSVKDEL
ncbi:MAG: AraC family transcriptional regulator [Bacteroidota bacterium]